MTKVFPHWQTFVIQTPFSWTGLCHAYMLRVYECVFCSIPLLFAYMCIRMTSSPRSIAGVPSGRALPGYPITACTPLVLIPAVLEGLAVWRHNKPTTKKNVPKLDDSMIDVAFSIHFIRYYLTALLQALFARCEMLF